MLYYALFNVCSSGLSWLQGKFRLVKVAGSVKFSWGFSGFACGSGNLLRDYFLRRFFRRPICNVGVVGIPVNGRRNYPQPMLLKIAGPHIRASVEGFCGLSRNIMADAPEFFVGELKVASHRQIWPRIGNKRILLDRPILT